MEQPFLLQVITGAQHADILLVEAVFLFFSMIGRRSAVFRLQMSFEISRHLICLSE